MKRLLLLKNKKHIDEFSTSEIINFGIAELEKIEGTEEMIYSLRMMNRNIETFRKNLKFISILAEKYNWFIEPSIPQRLLKKLFKSYEDELIVNKILMKYYRDNMTNSIKKICDNFPKRKAIIEEACRAHLNQNYYTSIVLLFTQIDGISESFKGKNFFQDIHWQKVETKIDSDIKNTIAYEFVKVFFELDLPIKMSKPKRDKIEEQENIKFNHLNRHQVLHGEITDFNTEINSLKTISLLLSLTFNLKYLDEKYKK